MQYPDPNPRRYGEVSTILGNLERAEARALARLGACPRVIMDHLEKGFLFDQIGEEGQRRIVARVSR
jgi:hypothetical protein